MTGKNGVDRMASGDLVVAPRRLCWKKRVRGLSSSGRRRTSDIGCSGRWFVAQRVEGADQRARRVGQRQSLFREVNEQIGNLAPGSQPADALAVVCECASIECNERIEIAASEYERLRRVPTRFAVLRGHELPEVERVVEESERYVVVEKLGDSAIAAIEFDPRRRRT
jgi:hypothetical protein